MGPWLEYFVVRSTVLEWYADVAAICGSASKMIIEMSLPKDASNSSVPQIWAKTSTIAGSDFKSHIHCSCATPYRFVKPPIISVDVVSVDATFRRTFHKVMKFIRSVCRGIVTVEAQSEALDPPICPIRIL